MEVIKVENLRFQYPKSTFELNIPHLLIEEGEKVAVIGPSGSGKTTLLNILSGIIIAENGIVEFDGNCLNTMNDSELRNLRINQIGFVFQDFKLLEYLSVYDNILLPYRINSSMPPLAGRGQRVKELCEHLGVADKISKFPKHLSHGEKQRIAISRALINDPSLVLADEPTGNLDPENKTKILEILFRMSDANESTLITVTHDHELLSGFDRIIDFADFQKNSGE
jgi:putative ABC transport system ATP-binding protein